MYIKYIFQITINMWKWKSILICLRYGNRRSVYFTVSESCQLVRYPLTYTNNFIKVNGKNACYSIELNVTKRMQRKYVWTWYYVMLLFVSAIVMSLAVDCIASPAYLLLQRRNEFFLLTTHPLRRRFYRHTRRVPFVLFLWFLH